MSRLDTGASQPPYKSLSRPAFAAVLGLLLTVAAFFQSCAPREVQMRHEEPIYLSSLAVLPVEPATEKKYEIDKSTVSLEQSAAIMDGLLVQYFAGKEQVRFVTPAMRQEASSKHADSKLLQYLYLGRKLHTDAVLACTLQRFIKRLGTQYSVENPASVAFQCSLVESTSGETLCMAEFNETQQALFDNLLTYKSAMQRGLKWITAEELAREGIKKSLDECKPLQNLK